MVLAMAMAVVAAGSPDPALMSTEISGTVRDGDGNPLARVAITVSDDMTGDALTQTVLTNDLGQFTTSVTVATSIGGENVPTEYSVFRVFPNPASAGQNILTARYTTPGNRQADPELEMFDVLGRRVQLPANLAAGMYLYRIRFDEKHISETQQLIVAEGGAVDVVLEQSYGTSTVSAATASHYTQSKTAVTTSVRVSAEKSGFVTAEVVESIENEVQIQVDFALQVAAPPTADFNVSGTLDEGGVVQFDATASSGAAQETLTYLWDFGTTAKGTGEKVGYVFPADGTYPVTLTVTGAFGTTASVSKDVVVVPGPDATGTVTTSTLVYDPVGLAIQGAAVSLVGDAATSTTTDQLGLAVLDVPGDVPLSLRVSKSGFTHQTVQLTTEDDGSPALATVTLYPRAAPVVLEDVELGGKAEGEDGASVELPFDALVDSQGEPVSGPVDISLTSIDVISDDIEAFPGRFEGVTSDGEQGFIVSFGVTEFTITQNDEELQLADGKRAEIEIPVYSERVTLGEEFPLWSVDEETGIWIQEGEGTIVEAPASPTGLSMRATVGHFSWYNIDVLGCGRSSDTGVSATAVAQCRDEETGEFVPCWARMRVMDEGAAPTGSVPLQGLAFLLCEGWPSLFKAWAALPSGVPGEPDIFLRGNLELPPAVGGITAEAVIPMLPLDLSEPVAIEYDDIIYSRIDGNEIDRYVLQGSVGDLVRLGVSASPSGDLDGLFRFRSPSNSVLEEFEFFDRPLFRFETLSADGEYVAEILPIGNDGPYRLQISKWEATDAPIALNSRENEFIWPGKRDLWRLNNDQPRTIQLRAQHYFSVADSVFSALLGNVILKNASGVEIASADFDRANAVLNLDIGVGEYLIDVGSRARSGEYHVDVEEITLVNGVRQIAYGDSLIWLFQKPGGSKQYEFSGTAGDVFRLDVDNIRSPSVFYDIHLIDANGDTLETVVNQYWLTHRLPSTGKYTVALDARFNSGVLQVADYGMPFRLITSPETVSMSVGDVLGQQSWDGRFGVNRYTFDGVAVTSVEVGVTGGFGSPSGLLRLFGPDGSMLGIDNFRRGTITKPAEIALDLPEDGQYTILVGSSFRYERTISRFSVRVVEVL